ncbi:MAG: ABC transporter ATP-binding protein [Hyphomicrobiales bacterium]
MPVLELTNITKRFGALVANDDISLSLASGEVLALLGENGAGKTTLMNILFGHYVADEGSVSVNGVPLVKGSTEASISAGIGMVHQHFTLADNLTVLENIILGTESLWSWKQDLVEAKRKLTRMSEQFGLAVDPDALIGDLSVGERQRVEILKALYRDARILILDEPTAVLTPQETASLFETLKQLTDDGLAVIFISHKLHEILAVSDRVAVLRRGAIVGTVETSDADRSLLAEMMVGEKVTRPTLEPMDTGAPVLQLSEINVISEEGVPLLRDASLAVNAHEIVGIAGVAGNGQRALADVLSGLAAPVSGSATLFDKALPVGNPSQIVHAGVGRIPEDRHAHGVVGEMAIWENLISEDLHTPQIAKAGVFVDKQAALARANDAISHYDVRCEGPDQQVRLLSGGNMQKLILARALSPKPSFILANQPVRGLDEGAIAFVQSQLLEARERGAGILFISEDLDELLSLSDRVCVMFHGNISAPFKTGSKSVSEIGLMMAGQFVADAEAGQAHAN